MELAKEVRALQEEIKERILEEARNKESRDKGNREREEKEREREREMRDKEREREVFETPSPSESQKNWERGSDSFSADKGERERERDTANGNDEEKKCNSFTSPHASADVSAFSHVCYYLCVDPCIYAVPSWPLNALSCLGDVCVCLR